MKKKEAIVINGFRYDPVLPTRQWVGGICYEYYPGQPIIGYLSSGRPYTNVSQPGPDEDDRYLFGKANLGLGKLWQNKRI